MAAIAGAHLSATEHAKSSGAASQVPLDLKAFSRHVCEELPAYARPLFLRLLRGGMDTTGSVMKP